MKKRILTFILSVVMMISMVPMQALAVDAGTEVYIDNQTITAGTTSITVPVMIKNASAFMAMGLKFEFNTDVFTLSGATLGSALSAVAPSGSITLGSSGADINFDNANDATPADGELIVLTFTVAEDVAAGNYVITPSVSDNGWFNYDEADVTATFKAGTITIEYETAGLTFNNGSAQSGMTYDTVKAEALGTDTLTTPGANYYFAGWFTGLDVTADENGFYVIDPTTATTFTGTEFRPRYENPPTEGEYHALWIKGDGTSVYALSLGSTYTVHMGTDGSTVLGAAITAANGSRTKLVMDMTLSTVINTNVPMHLDMNGCTLTAGADYILTLGENGNTAESSRAGGTFAGGKMMYFNLTWTADYSALAGGQFNLIRDITMNGSKSGQVINIRSATKIENCVFEGYLYFADSSSTAIDNCKITTSNMLIQSAAGEVTVTNTTMTSTGTNALMQGYNNMGTYMGTINLGAGNKVTATNATTLFTNLATAAFTSMDSTYQIKAGGKVVGNGTVTCPAADKAAAIDANGYVVFGDPCTVTYMKDDGSVLQKSTAVKDGYADLSVTYTVGNGKQYKLLGWSTEENATEPMTEILVSGDITVYAVKGRKGVLLGTGTTEYVDGDRSYNHNNSNSSTVSNRTFTIYNADQLSLLNSLTLNGRSSAAKIYFNAEALDNIASQITGETKDITVTFYYPTSGLGDGVKGQLQFAIAYGDQAVVINGGVEAQFKVTSSTGTAYNKFVAYEASNIGNTLAVEVKNISANNYYCFQLPGNGTYEVMQLSGNYLPETNTNLNPSINMGTSSDPLTVENAKKLADLNSMSISNNGIVLDFSAAALDDIAAKAAEGGLTVHVNNVTPTAEGAVARAELQVKDKDGKVVDFTGSVTVQINFTYEEGKRYRAYYVPETGDPVGLSTECTVTNADAKIMKAVFTTNHFSGYEIREVTAADGYTAELTTSTPSVRAGGKEVNITVAVSHKEDTTFNAGEIVIKYDPNLLTLDTTGLAEGTFKDDNGVLTIEDYGDNKDLPYSYNLTFTTIASLDAEVQTPITLQSAAFADKADAVADDLVVAALDPADVQITIQLESFAVTKDDTVGGSSEAVKNQDYTFTIEKDEHYTYQVTATVNGTEVTVTEDTDNPGSYTIAGANVTGPITITVVPVANQYDVTFTGEAPAANDGAKATHGTAYSFTLPTIAQHQVNYTVTINNVETTAGITANGNVITIDGSAITGPIVVNITKIQTEFNVTLSGSDASWEDTSGGALESGDTIKVTITRAPGYTYAVTATQANGTEVSVAANEDGTYNITGFSSDVTITVTKTLTGTVAFTEYLTLDADDAENPDNTSSSIFLAIFGGELEDGYIPYCNENPMYWSDKYEAYCYLVIASTQTVAEEDTTVSVESGTKTTINYSYNVNGSTSTDAADAQLVYDMYKAEYSTFNDEAVSMLKFLLADVNGSKGIDTEDAAAIITAILNPATT